MTALRDALLARLGEIREAADAATPEMDEACACGPDVTPCCFAVAADALDSLARVLEGLAEEVGRHTTTYDERGFWWCCECISVPGDSPDYACPFVRRWAERLGVTA